MRRQRRNRTLRAGGIGEFVQQNINPADLDKWGGKYREAERLFALGGEKWTLSNMKSTVARYVQRQEGIAPPAMHTPRAKRLDASAALITNVTKEFQILERELTRLKGIEQKYNNLKLLFKE